MGNNLLIIAPVAILLIGAVVFMKKFAEVDGDTQEEKVRSKYLYQRTQWFMSKNEHEVFDALVALVGQEYHVFPQVKLDKILGWKGNGKSSLYAMRHINQKSVDFLLCNKNYINPILVIELDDRTHEREDRKERDEEIEDILKGANFPLLRIYHRDISNPTELLQKIKSSIT